MNESLLREAKAYFHEHPFLLKLAWGFCQKYRSLGHFGGSLPLEHSPEEQRELSAFLSREAAAASRLSYKKFAEAWTRTRFASLPLPEVFLSLMPEEFLSKEEERRREAADWQRICKGLADKYGHDALATNWLEALDTGALHLCPKEIYHQEEILAVVAKALSELPKNGCERLPLFANRIAGNPHALDFEQTAGRLFLQAISFLKGLPLPVSIEDRTHLLEREAHILRDDILNFATIYGLRGWEEQGQEITYWREAAENYSPMNLPLREIVRAGKIFPAKGSCVYIVENSGVFSALADVLQENRRNTTLLALHGQLKAASWALLDRLGDSGASFYYAGDFDPEGLGIAHRLLCRYKNTTLWHMSLEEYQQAVLPLPEERLKKIPDNIHPQLAALAKAMQRHKKILYQESLIEEMARDLLSGKSEVK